MTLALMSKERYEGDIGYSYYSYDDGFFFYPSFCQGYEGYNQCDGMGPIHMDLMWVDFYLAEPMLNESEAEEEGVDPIAHEQEQALNAFDYVVALDAHVALYVDLEGGVADQNAAEEADPLFSGNWHAMLAFEEESGNYDFITDNSVSFDLRFSPLSFSLDGTVMFPSSVGAAQSDSAADEEEALNRVTVSLTFSDIDGYNHYSRYHSYYGYSSESLDLNYSASVRLSVDLGLIGLPQVEASIHGGVDGYEYRNTYYPGYTSRYGYDEFFIYDGELQLSFDDSVISITQEDQGEETGLYTLRNGDNAQLSLNLSLTDQDESVGHLGLYNSDSDIYGYIYQANDSWLIRYSDGTFESLLPATVGQ